MTFVTILSALLGGIIGFAAAGFGAASVLVAALGDHDGGNAMGGFFGFGPIGGIAGILLGAGLARWFGGGAPRQGRRLMIAAGIVLAAGGVLLAIVSTPDRRLSYSYVIEFELEYPAEALAAMDVPGPHAMWGAGGANADDHPISQFFEKKCDGAVCVLAGSVAAAGPMNNFRITTAIGKNNARYPLDVPLTVHAPVNWSDWRQGDGARVRWRIVRR